ncbi:DJ-1/PfpI family protein [Aminiphilus circumscriptus]|uniref:DJ-1/PfpI family protein n=1 Tax=Aminiphilus circumscriptus TaxID=290732 RepID=UPI000492DFCC|nr:DJ-1/PfpI family protein [Aminiphilus circumscriptus]
MYTVGILLFRHVEELDFVGPFEVLSYVNKIFPESTRVLLTAETLHPVDCFNGMRVLPHATFDECPPLDVLVAPGGKGRIDAMKHMRILDFVRNQSRSARYVTSVCTGAFLLAEAGLLRGKCATTHGNALVELAAYPFVTVTQRKVVQDGNIVTAGGVSSGIDLGIHILALLFGHAVAKNVAHLIEYEPNISTSGDS